MATRRCGSDSLFASLLIGAFCAAAPAADNYFLPHGSNLWDVAGSWSLSHCPLTKEDVHVNVSTTSHKTVEYDWSGSSSFNSVQLNGSTAGYYAMIFHPEYVLTTNELQIAQSGPAWYWMEGPAFLWVNDVMYVGSNGTNSGHFYLATASDMSAGLYVGDLCYVGYSAPGDFDHVNGFVDVGQLYVGQHDPGTYWLKPGAASFLTVQGQVVIGNGDTGTFEQTGGTFEQVGTNGIMLGFNTGGVGTYLMKGGTLDVDHISIAWNGDGYFTHSGGTVTTAGDINVGCQGTHPMRAWYKLNQNDGTAALNVGDDLLIGVQTLGKYEQEGGTATVAGNVEIWDGDPDAGSSSYLYMGLSAGVLEAAAFINHTGYFDQDGGVFDAWDGANDSTQGINLDNNADCRIRNFTNNAGAVQLWRNAILRGPHAFGDTYGLCELVNNATFQMGSAATNGGSFRGHLTNNGTFTYYQGDFSTSRLTNYGTVNLNGDLTALRVVNYATLTVPTGRMLSARGTGYANAVENNSNLTVRADGRIVLPADKALVNNGPMYAGGPGATPATIQGAVQTNNFLLPSDSSLPAGSQLVVTGNFTTGSSAELRIRLRGTGTSNYDRLTVQGAATLAGELDVRLTDGYVPTLGATFYPVSWTSRSGQFSPVSLPTLPAGLAWDVCYGTTSLRLKVIAAPDCPEDIDDNGQIDRADLSALLTNYGLSGAGLEGDIDGDNDVDLADLSALLTVFGTACP